MAGKFLIEKNYTPKKRYLKYYNLILMILFAGVVALVLFFANKGEKRFRGKDDSGLIETINVSF